MSFEHTEVSFKSSDGTHTVYGEIYVPKGTPIRGVLQLSHGMTDHVGRYGELARFVTARGFVFAGHCHIGHGKSVSTEDELGFFALKHGVEILIEDMRLMNGLLKERFGGAPIIVMGHSMGSFIARIFTARYPESVSALIIHGTSGPNKAVFAGKALVRVMSFFKGKKYRSKFVKNVASRGYNKKFPKEEGPNAWLTRDTELANEKLSDPLGNYTFTLSAYADLFRLVESANSKLWFRSYPNYMPTLIVSGEMDPVGGYGKGVRYVCNELLRRGHTALTLKLYEGARHELFNEINREEVFSDIVDWMDQVKL